MGYRDHSVARTDTTSTQGEMKGIRATSRPDRVSDAKILSELLVKSIRLFPKDVPSTIQDLGDGSIDFALAGQIRCERIGWKQKRAGMVFHLCLFHCSLVFQRLPPPLVFLIPINCIR